MCGRFAQAIPLGSLKKIDLFSRIEGFIPESYNVAPGEEPAIITNHEGYMLQQSVWGFVNPLIKNNNKKQSFINARSETAADKFYFRQAFKKGRCLIPVNGFYEWRKTGKEKIPFYISAGGEKSIEEDILFLAGIYSQAAGDTGRTTFAILTRDALPPVSEIHDRMPVIIATEGITTWLNESSEADELMKIITADYSNALKMHRVSPLVNSPRYKEKDAVTAI